MCLEVGNAMVRWHLVDTNHRFSSFILDPIPPNLWRGQELLTNLRLGACETCGFVHVHPYPDAEYLQRYYSEYEAPTDQANIPEFARFLKRHIQLNSKVIDMGCGDGSFLAEMQRLGFSNLHGFDDGPGFERASKLPGLSLVRSDIYTFLSESERNGGTDAAAFVMTNVLEHVPDPLALLHRVHRILPPGGLICVMVPNEFNPLQTAFLKAKGHRPWFVCLPDHLNYFNFESLTGALSRCEFDVIDQSAVYPLELFLLQDLDYIAHPELGKIAHERRVMFEKNLKDSGMVETLDHFYRTLASGGYGRDLMILARKR